MQEALLLLRQQLLTNSRANKISAAVRQSELDPVTPLGTAVVDQHELDLHKVS